MASPHVPDDMLQPTGMLTPGLFPNFASSSDDLDTFLQGLLDEGYARAGAADPPLATSAADAAAIDWAYHRAYLAVWQRMSSTPSSAAIEGEASRTFLAGQIDTFRQLSDSFLVAFNTLMPTPPANAGASVARTQSVPNTYVW